MEGRTESAKDRLLEVLGHPEYGGIVFVSNRLEYIPCLFCGKDTNRETSGLKWAIQFACDKCGKVTTYKVRGYNTVKSIKKNFKERNNQLVLNLSDI